MGKYRVLSLDGGGIRGVITVVLLQRLMEESGVGDLLEKVDLVAGTSTGGLLALGIGAGLDLSTMRSLYEERGEVIFDDSFFDDVLDVGKLGGADYDIGNLEKELKKIFGGKKLKDLSKKVLVTAFDLDNGDEEKVSEEKRTWKPKLFHNYPGEDTDGDESVVKVGCATSAAPTYFDTYEGYVDGGVFAGNPSLCALAQVLDSRSKTGRGLDEIVLLSLGTGTARQYVKGKSLDWGYAQWIKPLVNLMLDGTAGIADFQCQQLLGDRYWRVAPAIPPKKRWEMDDWKKVPEMIAFATDDVDLTKAVEFLKKKW